MTKPHVINTALRGGVWEAEVADLPAGDVTVLHEGSARNDVTCTYDENRKLWRIRVPIQAELISDGVQTFVVNDANGNQLTHFTIIAGEGLMDDLRAEIALLRAELDILKSAFRKHCAEG